MLIELVTENMLIIGMEEMRILRFVPNGVYFYRIDIGDDEPLYGKIMVLM